MPLEIPLAEERTGHAPPNPCAGTAATIAIIGRNGRQRRMAERKNFLLLAMAVGAAGIAAGAYVMWEMLVRITGP